MRRAAVAIAAAAVALAGCGGEPAPEEQLRDTVREKTEKVRERVERAGRKARESDKALLQIEKTDLPDDIKKELLEAQELLDRQAD